MGEERVSRQRHSMGQALRQGSGPQRNRMLKSKWPSLGAEGLGGGMERASGKAGLGEVRSPLRGVVSDIQMLIFHEW